MSRLKHSTESDENQIKFFPICSLYERDKVFTLIFIVVYIIAGQIGIIASLLITIQYGGLISETWQQNLSSGALYTFSISLVVSVLAVIGSEVIDILRNKIEVIYLETKLIWGSFALVVLLLLTVLVGPLLSKPASTVQVINVNKTTPTSTELTKNIPIVTSPNNEFDQGQNENHFLQIFLWIGSMFVSLQLFALHRLPLIPEHHAKDRNQLVKEIEDSASKKNVTDFGEKI
jgi:hypothetical protein